MDKLRYLADVVDTLQERIGRAVSWLLLAVALAGFAVAVLRYGFGVGAVWLQEAQVWLHGGLFLLAAGWTLLHDAHVRVDIWYRPAPPRRRALVDLLGSVFLLLPMSLTILWYSVPYVLQSWRRLEGSREAGGLPGLFLLKSVIPVFCVLLALQGLSLAVRSALRLRAGATGGHPEGSP